VLKEQTNAKEIVLLAPGETWGRLGVKVLPVHAALGPAFRNEAGRVLAELKTADGKLSGKAIAENGSYLLKEWTLTADMVTFRDSIPQSIAQAGFSAAMFMWIQNSHTR